MGILEKVFGNRNTRELKKLQPIVEHIGSFEKSMQAKDDAELAAMTVEFKQRLENGADLEDILPEAFATVREAGWRILKMRHYDVQLIGGLILHRGRIAEMRTGEGKTLAATLPLYLNALEGKGAHLVTVNDYLAARDAEWMSQIYNFLGLSCGTIVHGIEDYERQQAYQRDITYGQNSEFGFDYLRDNMKMQPDRMVQRGLHYAVVDEVDSILIDEARTPLIISGPAERKADLYIECDKIVPRLKRDIDYTVDEKAHSAMLTDTGVEKVESLLKLDNLYDPKNIQYVHHMSNALKAHTLYKRDDQYLIEDSKVVIVDEFTGRKMPGRRWSDGLHQSIEAKENVEIEEENQTLATVTYQNFFRMYSKLSGMTGTADTEAAEFHHIYKLDCSVIPTNKPIIRKDEIDLVYKNEKGKFNAIMQEIVDSYEIGQPVLVGTTSVEKSEVIAKFLRTKDIPFEVLNAKQHEREAGIVAQAGRKGAITISTNMAGRGTDIILGGNAEQMTAHRLETEGRAGDDEYHAQVLAEHEAQHKIEREQVLAAGGLKIIGTERHESRRIDNQLRGRAGRQGDPGASRFYLSLEDNLMRIFGGERVTRIMELLGMEEDVPIDSKMVTRSVENAQKKVEGSNFDSRKNVLEYDDVMNQQRKTIYGLRLQILRGQYFPTLSEEQEKAGTEPTPPSQSGDWTVEILESDVRKDVEKWVDAAIEAQEAIDNPPEPEPTLDEQDDEDDEGEDDELEFPDDDAPPIWRQFRHEVWRQSGAQVDDVEKHWGDRDDLIEYITDAVCRSMIQQRERLLDLCDTVIGRQVDTHCPPTGGEDQWDLDGLRESIRDQFGVDLDMSKGMAPPALATQLWKQVEERIGDREKDLTRPWLLYFVRHFYLEEIDNLWRDHLTVMEHLRQGIGLRGYGQKDPKKEYKKEGFDLFSAMMETIETNVTQKIFRVQMRREEDEIPELQALEREMSAEHPEADGGSDGPRDYGDSEDAVPKQGTVKRDKPKVGRNDPCPCGSGKKYKKCHGRASATA